MLFEPRVLEDERGVFFETFNDRVFREVTGLDVTFVQDNQSVSRRGVLRGMHYQVRQRQGKLVRVVAGKIFDVAVDMRRDSPTFGNWASVTLSASNRRMFWIPAGFAHGFLALAPSTVLYKTTDYYLPDAERCLLWNDPAVGIKWPIDRIGVDGPLLSGKDLRGRPLDGAEPM